MVRSMLGESVARLPLPQLAQLAILPSLQFHLPPEARWNFRVILTHWVLAGVFTGVIGSYLAVVARRLGADEVTVALVFAGQFVGGMLAISGPFLLRSIPPARAVSVLWAVARLAFVAALFIDSAGPYLAMVLTWALIAMFGVPLYVGVMQAAFPPPLRGRVIGVVQGSMAIVVLVVAPLSGALMDTVGYGPVFAGAGIVGAIGATALLRVRVKPAPRYTYSSPWQMFHSTISNHRFRRYVSCTTIGLFGEFLLMPTIAVVLVDTFNASFAVIGILAMIQGFTWAGGYLLWGVISDRKSGPFVVWMGTFLKMVVAAIFVIAILVENVWLLVPAYAAIGLNFASGDLGWQTSMAALAHPEEVDAFSTSFWLILGALGVVGPLLGAAILVAGGPIAVFACALGLAAIGSLLVGRLARGFVPVDATGTSASLAARLKR